jgi:ABC-type multidrug transport system ATPase subunit
VEALLHQTNLWEARRRRLGTFSGGMKQRFGIAQALLGDPKLLIVDEPTAGLDPAERNRFLNLLGEVGENIVVILSTHIVEDVTDLCSQMAIIAQGSVRLAGQPAEVIASLRGRVWQAVVPRDRLDQLRAQHDVISTHLHAGRNVVHVLADASPGPDFEAVQPTLEDAYFATIRERREPVVACCSAPSSASSCGSSCAAPCSGWQRSCSRCSPSARSRPMPSRSAARSAT